MAKNAQTTASAATAGTTMPPRQGPQGTKLEGPGGPGHLYPGAGIASRKSGEPIFCGEIAGLAFGYLDHPNQKDPTKTSTRFQGDFLFKSAKDGSITMRKECYLPGVVGNALRAALSLQANTIHAEPLKLAIEVWAEPDEFTNPNRPTATGYVYACYDRRKEAAQASPLLMLAAESGFVDMPALAQPALAAPSGEYVDPETGEVHPQHPNANAA